MNVKKLFKLFFKRGMKISDIYHYLLGNYRYKLYYSPTLVHLMRGHIYEQITYRIEVQMNRTCYDNGECIHCGCETTKLQMSNRACDGGCYTQLMNREDWYNSLEFHKMNDYYEGILEKESRKFK